MKLVYTLLVLLCFGLGGYAWKLARPSHRRLPGEQQRPTMTGQTLESPGVLVSVGKSPITQADLEWEYRLHTRGIEDRENLTPIPDMGDHQDIRLDSLRTKLLSEIVERKMLFAFIASDAEFARDDPARYIDCQREWLSTIQQEPEAYASEKDQERLKERLCQKSVLDQYMAERLFSQVEVSDEEIADYYKNHLGEFRKPERVLIRQVVLASERDAKNVRAKLRRNNFEELARTKSIAPEAEQGGLLGPYARGEMPRTFDIAFRMRRGQISDIQKSTYGFHLIMLEEKLEAEELSLEEATASIEVRLRRLAEEARYKTWLDEALSTVDVKTPKPLW